MRTDLPVMERAVAVGRVSPRGVRLWMRSPGEGAHRLELWLDAARSERVTYGFDMGDRAHSDHTHAFAYPEVMVKGKASSAMPFREAVKKAGIQEISHRAERRDDYEGYAMKMPTIAISRHGIGGVQFAEVAVDTETGIVKVERILAVHDRGRPINPKLTESQIHGGVIQGVSYALYEERHLDPASGHQLNANVDQYKIVGSREVPRIKVHLLEQLGAQSSTDARGVAEPANVATAAAVANAFYNATGKRIRTLPMTPANVLAALRT
jgi:xanthine dehydrogenase YagR molybdenum-binding subunit